MLFWKIWQANENGVYDNTSDDYVYRASWKTVADGRYNFRTIMPVPYKVSETAIRPAHIHMRISRTTDQDLVTQIYLFRGDKYIPGIQVHQIRNQINRIFDVIPNARNERLVKLNVVPPGCLYS